MIITTQSAKGSASLAELLGGNAGVTEKTGNDLFSKLLASLSGSSSLKDFKTVVDPKNGTLKISDPKEASLKEIQALLKGEEESSENTFLSQQLLTTLSDGQVRNLIQKAKEYLKNEISSKAPEYQNDSKALPKSLAGLIQLADKLGLEPQTITLSTLMPEETQLAPELLAKPILEAKVLNRLSEAPVEEKNGFEAISQLLNQLKKLDPKDPKTARSETTEKSPVQDVQPLKALLQGVDKADKQENVLDLSPKKEAKADPAAASTKTDGLIALLQGESRSQNSETEDESHTTLKTDGEASKTHQLKSDSFEVKTKEAQQSMRHFATDLKEAVENYKPPFTRLTMKLNPEKLGEVEVTLVQRGNNVHVNIQSNSTNAVAFLAHNATELKAQLAHQGITNATMNFMAGGDGQNSQGQQQQQQSQNRFQAYQSFEELELNEEQLGALEIIIPHYA